MVPDGGPTNDVAAVGATQSDLFSTQTPEARRKAKQEFDRVLDATETGKSSTDTTLEGREVLIRGGRVIIRAEKGAPSPKDFRADATGMDREQIAIELRFALDDLNRRAPMSPPPLGEAAPVQPPAAAEATAGAKPTPEKTSGPEPARQTDAGVDEAETSQPGGATGSSAPERKAQGSSALPKGASRDESLAVDQDAREAGCSGRKR